MDTDKKHTADRHTPKVISATFMRGITGSNPILNDELQHIAFVGRSNVGKSSTINTLLGKTVARASKTPGKTQEINFFRAAIEGERGKKFSRYIVDLPGYGYARIPVPEAEKIRKHIVWYLTSEEIYSALLVLIVDAAVGVTDFDRELVALAHEAGRPLIILLNKIDKLNQKERAAATKKIREEFPEVECFLFSAKTKEGKKNVLKSIFSDDR